MELIKRGPRSADNNSGTLARATRARRGACMEAGDAAREHAKFRLRIDAAARGVELAGPKSLPIPTPRTWEIFMVAASRRRPDLPKVRRTNRGGGLVFPRLVDSHIIDRSFSRAASFSAAKVSSARENAQKMPIFLSTRKNFSNPIPGGCRGFSIQVAAGRETIVCVNCGPSSLPVEDNPPPRRRPLVFLTQLHA